MDLVIVTVGLVVVIAVVVRLAVGFLRWARKHPIEGGGWMVGVYLREEFGDWVDRVSDAPEAASHDGHGDHHSQLHHYHSGGEAHHHHDAGYHSSDHS